MLIRILFALLLLYFATTDMDRFIIPNFVILPAIIIGCILTGYWLPALAMFILGACFFEKEIFRGGDVKLMTLVGAFIGLNSVWAFTLSLIVLVAYRHIKRDWLPLPYAPFIAFSCLFFMW